jgi:histidinol-phosphate/aromatic aminotransferase/cobyric acid decarboxylase-like protein
MHAALANAHLYPDGSGLYLCKAISARLGLAPENVILGNGSNEVLEFLGHAFLDAKRQDEVIASKYAFVVYKLIATSFGARMIEVPEAHMLRVEFAATFWSAAVLRRFRFGWREFGNRSACPTI